jgi:hypothetical protein
MGRRTLALRREALAELTTNEMSAVGGAQLPPWTPVIHTLPVNVCLHTIADCLVATVGC